MGHARAANGSRHRHRVGRISVRIRWCIIGGNAIERRSFNWICWCFDSTRTNHEDLHQNGRHGRDGPVWRAASRQGCSADRGLWHGRRIERVLGLARAESLPAEIDALLAAIQNELFDLGAELATPDPAKHGRRHTSGPSQIATLEAAIDRYEATLPAAQAVLLARRIACGGRAAPGPHGLPPRGAARGHAGRRPSRSRRSW